MKGTKEYPSANNDSGKTLLTAENSQILNDLTHAIDECKTLLREIIDYYREIERYMQDAESAKPTLPTPEEIDVVRQRWTGFSTSASNLSKNARLGLIRNQISLGPRSYDTEVFDPSWFEAEVFTPTNSSHRDQLSPSAGTQAEPRAILDAADTSPRDASPVAPNSTIAPDDPPKTKRSFFRRLLSYLSIKRFRFWK